MASRITDFLGRIAVPLIFAFLGLFIFICAFQKQQWDSDIFWALKSGEWIVTHLQVPHTDPFSYTFGGAPWVDFTWGFQVLAYLFHSLLGGWTGLFILQALIVALTFVFLYAALRAMLPGRPWLSVPLLVLAYAAAHNRLFIRPHLFEFFFVSLYFMLLALYEKKGKPVYLFLILPAQALWVNIHSSAVLGLFMVGAYAIGKLLDEVRARGFKNFDLGKEVVVPGLAALLAPVVALINPYGLKLVLFPFVHNGVDNADAIRHIGEWSKPGLKELFFFLYPFPSDHFAFIIIFTLALACLILNARNTKSWAYILFAGSIYMAVSHVRWVPLFAVFGAPVAAMGLRGVLERLDGKAWPRIAALSVAAVMTLLLAHEYMKPGGVYASNMGLGVKPGKFPEGTVAYMKKEGLRGNIYNEYVFGGYIIYELPELKVFIDGRTPTVYSSYFFWTSRLAEDRNRWKRLEEEHKIDMVLVQLESGLCGKLRDNKEWAAVSFDDVSILYVKKGRFPSQASNAITGLNPCAGNKFEMPEDKEALKKVVDELERLLSSGNTSARPRRLLGLAYTKQGKEEGYVKAADEFRKAIAINEDAYTWYDLGVALGKSKKRDEATAAFSKAIALDKRFREAWLAYGAALHDNGRHKDAIAALTRYLELADDKAEALAYSSLGKSYFQTGEFEKAAAYLKRAAFLTDEKKELGDLYYNIGNSHFELAEYDEGLRWYERALSVKPDYANVMKELALGFSRRGNKEAAGRIFTLDALKGASDAVN
jgi:tetratricopeptide (TPR) repeat protein